MAAGTAQELAGIPMSANLAATLGRAAEYASAQAHREVSLEHLLLSLTEDPDAGTVLTASNVDLGGLKGDVSSHLGRIDDRFGPDEKPTPRLAANLVAVLKAASAAAQGRRSEIDGAIVLAAVVGDGNSTAAHLLSTHGLTFEEAIRVLKSKLAEASAQAAAPAPASPAAVDDVEPAPQAPAEPRPAPVRERPPESTDEILAGARARVKSRTGSSFSLDREVEPETEVPQPIIEEDAAAQNEAGAMIAGPPEAVPTPKPGPQPTPGAAQPAPGPQPAPAPQSTPPPATWSPTPVPGPAPQSAPPNGPANSAGPLGQRLPQARRQPAVPPPGPRPHPAAGPANPPWGEQSRGPMPSPDHVFAGNAAPQPHPYPAEPGARPAGLERAPVKRAPPPGAAQPGPVAGQARAKPQSASVQAGQLVENIPRRMRVGIAATVEARIAKAEVKALADGLQGGGSAYRHEVMVTKAMSVRLRAPDGGFFIETASPETQWIENTLGLMQDDFASWRWNVTPNKRGRKRLQLIVSARTIGSDGLAAETALPDKVIEVRVRTNYARASATLGAWIIAAVVGGLLARFGEGLFEAGRQLAATLLSGG